MESTSAGDTTIHGRWAGSTDVGDGLSSYRVQLATTPDFAATMVDRSTGSTATSITFTAADGVATNASYYFRVAAVDAAGNTSTWSAPSNRVGVRQSSNGPAIAHAPVATAFVGQPIPIEIQATCEPGAACSASLYYRSSAPAQNLAVTGTPVGFTKAALTAGAETTLNGARARTWTGSIPGSTITTTGVDYFIEADDNLAIASFPGTTFVGTNSTPGVDGARVGYIHVNVLSPPLLGHVPPTYTNSGQPIPLTLQATCSDDCDATVYFRTTTGPITNAEAVLADDGDLLTAPAWDSAPMVAAPNPQDLGDAGAVVTFTFVIPASYVDTRGVDYVFEVSDGSTTSWSPGTSYVGYYAPQDGIRTGHHHVHVLETPHIAHVPVSTAPYRQPITIEAQANCSAAVTCTAELYYRTTTSDFLDFEAEFARLPMTVTRAASGVGGQDLVSVAGTIPASVVDTRGVDYFFSISDGTTTSWWPGTSNVDGFGYVPIPGERVGYSHIRVQEPPHLLHLPPGAAPALTDLTITTDLSCATEACTVALFYSETLDAPLADYTRIEMARNAVRATTEATRVETWAGTIPGADVTTRGLNYLLVATDGFTSTAAPGTTYQGAYLPADGEPVGEGDPTRVADLGVTVTMSGTDATTAGSLTGGGPLAFPIRVLEPPHPVHLPTAASTPGTPIALSAVANCSSPTCDASLRYRTTGRNWRTSTMVGTRTTTPLGDAWAFAATIPGSYVTTEGVDYSIEVNDGYVQESTPTWHVTVPNGATLSPFPATADTTIKNCPSASCAGPFGSLSSMSVSSYLDGLTSSRDDALLRFDTTAVPSTHAVLAATLVLNVTGDADLTALTRAITSDWSEATASRATRPSVSATSSPAVLVPGQVRLDVTSLVAGWVAAPEANRGLQLDAGTLLTHRTTISSREGAVASRPILEVTHVATDQVAPTVRLTSPTAPTKVFGAEPLRATATDGEGVSSVEFLVDDVVVGTDVTAPFEVLWDTTGMTDGLSVEIWARAIDTAGNAQSSTRIAATVDNSLPSSDRVRADRDGGLITIDEAARLGMYATLNPKLLPERYLSPTPEFVEPLAGTADSLATWDALQPGTRVELIDFMSFVPDGASAVGRAGAGGPPDGPSSAGDGCGAGDEYPRCIPDDVRQYNGTDFLRGCAPDETVHGSVLGDEDREYCVYDSDPRFTIRWRPAIPGFDDGPGGDPDRGIPVSDVSPLTHTPTFLSRMVNSLDVAWDTYDAMGFTEPTDPVQIVVGAIETEAEESIIDGPGGVDIEFGVGSPGYVSPFSHQMYLSAESSIYLPKHELFHSFQYEYVDGVDIFPRTSDNPLLAGPRPEDPFFSRLAWIEATAEWGAHGARRGESVVVGYASDLDTFLATPSEALLFYAARPYRDPGEPSYQRHYGNFLLAEYLEELPGLASVVRRSFERMRDDDQESALDALEALLNEQGTSFAEILPDFAQANYLLQKRGSTNLSPEYLSEHHLEYVDNDVTAWRTTLEGDLPSGDPKPTNGAGYDGFKARPARSVSESLAPGDKYEARGAVAPGGAQYLDVRHQPLDGRRLLVDVQVDNDNAAAADIELDLMTFDDYPGTLCGRFSVPVVSGRARAEIILAPSCSFTTLVVSHVDPRQDPRTDDPYVDFEVSVRMIDRGTTVTNNVIELGINAEGGLAYDRVGLRLGTTHASSVEGIHNQPLPGDGWGIADMETDMVGFFSREEGRFNLENPSIATGSGFLATSSVSVGSLTLAESGGLTVRSPNTFTDNSGRLFGVAPALGNPRLRVTHSLLPSQNPNAYMMRVRVTNTGDRDVDLLYRRVVDWAVEPTPGLEFVTIEGGGADGIRFVGAANGTSVNPLTEPNPVASGDVDHAGPGDLATTFDIALGALERGESISFDLFYGAFASELDARIGATNLGVTTYAMAQASNGGIPATAGVTFVLGYKPA